MLWVRYCVKSITNTFSQLTPRQIFEVSGQVYTAIIIILDEETGLETLKNLPQITQLEIGRLWT